MKRIISFITMMSIICCLISNGDVMAYDNPQRAVSDNFDNTSLVEQGYETLKKHEPNCRFCYAYDYDGDGLQEGYVISGVWEEGIVNGKLWFINSSGDYSIIKEGLYCHEDLLTPELVYTGNRIFLVVDQQQDNHIVSIICGYRNSQAYFPSISEKVTEFHTESGHHYAYDISDYSGKEYFYHENTGEFSLEREQEIKIVLNGQELSFDQPPINTPEGRLLVPIRKIAENMNRIVLWSDETKTAFIDNSDNGLIIPLYEMQMYIANESGFSQWQRVPLDVPAMEINGRTLVPVRAFCESLGADVKWVNEEKTAYITYDDTVAKERMNDTLFDSICLTYYIEEIADNPFAEYSVSIDDFYNNRTEWMDAVTMGLSDPFSGVNDWISGSSNAVNVIKMSLSEIISEIPNGEPSDYDAGIVKLLKDAVANGVDIYSDVGGLNSTIRNYSEVYRTLDDALLDYSKNYHNKVSGIFDLSVFSLEELAYILTDYECNIDYINAFENGLRDAGLLDNEISEAIDLLRTDYTDKFIGVALDLRGQLFEYGVTESLTALLDPGVGLGKLAWDAFFTVMGVNSQGEDLKVFYGTYCIDAALNNAVSNKMSYDKPNTSAEILEFRSLWEMTRAEKITAYKVMKGITNKKDSKEYADEQINEMSSITYRLFK